MLKKITIIAAGLGLCLGTVATVNAGTVQEDIERFQHFYVKKFPKTPKEDFGDDDDEEEEEELAAIKVNLDRSHFARKGRTQASMKEEDSDSSEDSNMKIPYNYAAKRRKGNDDDSDVLMSE